MKMMKSLSLTLFMSLLFMIACQEQENVYPDGTEVQHEKSMPSGYENNPVEQFVGTNPIDVSALPPVPTMTPLRVI